MGKQDVFMGIFLQYTPEISQWKAFLQGVTFSLSLSLSQIMHYIFEIFY